MLGLRVDEHEVRLARIAEKYMRMGFAQFKVEEACRNVHRYRSYRFRKLMSQKKAGA